MPKKRARKFSLKQLTEQAKTAVVAEQKISYDFLRSKLPVTGIGIIRDVIRALEKQGIVAHVGRKYEVLQAADGTKKEPTGPVRKRRRKIRRSRQNKPVTAQPAKAAAPRLNGTGNFSDTDKLKKLNDLATATGKDGTIWKEIAADLAYLAKNRKVLEAVS